MVPEKDEPAFGRGKDYLMRNKQEEALTEFRDVIEKRMRSRESAPESHLEVGRIYLNHFKDPVEAIHHFRKYLELKPDSPQADKVEGLIRSATKDFAKTLPGQPYGENMDRLDLMGMLKQVTDENLQLKRQLALAVEKIKALGGGAFVPAPRANNPDLYVPPEQVRPTETTETITAPEVYTVQSGDSLYKISARVYGSGAYWEPIFKANLDQLSSPKELRPGMVLRIPPNPRN